MCFRIMLLGPMTADSYLETLFFTHTHCSTHSHSLSRTQPVFLLLSSGLTQCWSINYYMFQEHDRHVSSNKLLLSRGSIFVTKERFSDYIYTAIQDSNLRKLSKTVVVILPRDVLGSTYFVYPGSTLLCKNIDLTQFLTLNLTLP